MQSIHGWIRLTINGKLRWVWMGIWDAWVFRGQCIWLDIFLKKKFIIEFYYQKVSTIGTRL